MARATTNTHKQAAEMAELPELVEKAGSDVYKAFVVSRDADYAEIDDINRLVQKFIVDHGLIIYGGAALDYALRLKGSNIYPDNVVLAPDFDFYSYDSVNHAYKLAKLMYDAGFAEARAISALHLGTMRVDIANNHFVADLSYCPREVFDKLPTLEYNGMKFIHPDYQRLDAHHSLAFPYEYSPREVIFARWDKDIRRLNQVAAYYDIKPADIDRPKLKSSTYSHELTAPFHGFGAYALIFSVFVEEAQKLGQSIPANIIRAEFTAAKVSNGGSAEAVHRFTYPAMDEVCEFVHFNPEKCSERLGLTNVAQYEPYFNLLPAYLEGDLPSRAPTAKTQRARIYSTRNNLVSIGAASIAGYPVKIRFTNIQYLLHYFLAKYFIERPSPMADIYQAHYCSLVAMTRVIEAAYDKMKSEDEKNALIFNSVVFPSIVTFGADNISSSQELLLSKVNKDLYGVAAVASPTNYYPAKRQGGDVPTADLSKFSFFHELGRQIHAAQAEK